METYGLPSVACNRSAITCILKHEVTANIMMALTQLVRKLTLLSLSCLTVLKTFILLVSSRRSISNLTVAKTALLLTPSLQDQNESCMTQFVKTCTKLTPPDQKVSGVIYYSTKKSLYPQFS